MCGTLPNIRIARLNSHVRHAHSDSVVIIDILLDSHYIIICTQKVWSLRQQNYLNYPTFTEYTQNRFLLIIFQLFPACCYVAKIRRYFCGALFCGAPVRPNMLNMPRSASEVINESSNRNCIVRARAATAPTVVIWGMYVGVNGRQTMQRPSLGMACIHAWVEPASSRRRESPNTIERASSLMSRMWRFCAGVSTWPFAAAQWQIWTNQELSLIHIWRCRRIERCRSRWSPYH